MIEVPLTKGKVALIDDADLEIVSAYKWRACYGRWRDTWYAIAHTPMVSGKRRTIQMHRIILNAPLGTKVDHVDFDGLNNQRHNVRLATSLESSQHSRKRVVWRASKELPEQPTSSCFKGVSLDKRHGTWKSQIRVGGKMCWIGQYKTEVAAAMAYDAKAQALHGNFAVLNFPSGAITAQKEG